MSDLSCPPHERLADCAAGVLDEAAAAEVRKHVAGCSYCRAALDAFLRDVRDARARRAG